MNTFRIFYDCPLSDSALGLLRDGVAPHELILSGAPASSVLAKSSPDPALARADIAFGQPDVAGVLGAPGLRWLHISSAGYTRYDTAEFHAAARSRGLLVSNSSSVYSGPCAEHALAFMLAQSRTLPGALASHSANGSAGWNALRHGCRSLRNQELLLLGFGAIARQLVRLLEPFEMRVSALRRAPDGTERVPVVMLERLPEALARADHVVSLLPESAGTRRFLSRERIAQMKPGAIFYNIGRGATVDQEALADALRSGHLAAAWLDVTDPEPLPAAHPLRGAPNCYITPHIAGGHRNETETLVRHFLDNFQRFLKGAALRDQILK
jgi:phosphoglycerate dehydrogenase-like enzyme